MSDDKCTCWSHEENPSCKAKCINSKGSYECECSDGYYLLGKEICIGKSNCYYTQPSTDQRKNTQEHGKKLILKEIITN